MKRRRGFIGREINRPEKRAKVELEIKTKIDSLKIPSEDDNHRVQKERPKSPQPFRPFRPSRPFHGRFDQDKKWLRETCQLQQDSLNKRENKDDVPGEFTKHCSLSEFENESKNDELYKTVSNQVQFRGDWSGVELWKSCFNMTHQRLSSIPTFVDLLETILAENCCQLHQACQKRRQLAIDVIKATCQIWSKDDSAIKVKIASVLFERARTRSLFCGQLGVLSELLWILAEQMTQQLTKENVVFDFSKSRKYKFTGKCDKDIEGVCFHGRVCRACGSNGTAMM